MRSFALLLTVVGLVALGGWLARERLGGGADAAGGAPASLSGMLPADAPPELRAVFGSIDDARRDALPAFLGGGGGGARATAARPDPSFADAGRPAAVARVRRAVRRTLRRAADEDRARVLAWQGVVVSGDRAVARLDVQRLVVMPSGTRRARPPERVTLGLRRTRGWRVVSASR